jgi:hypothetical protein
MSLGKNRPKCSPNDFLSTFIYNFYLLWRIVANKFGLVKKIAQSVAQRIFVKTYAQLFLRRNSVSILNFRKKTPKVKQPPNGLKFGASGRPDCQAL